MYKSISLSSLLVPLNYNNMMIIFEKQRFEMIFDSLGIICVDRNIFLELVSNSTGNSNIKNYLKSSMTARARSYNFETIQKYLYNL